MNKEKILALADFIKNNQTLEMGFNMGGFWEEDKLNYAGEYCDTVACIAGWAVFQETGKGLSNNESYVTEAIKILDLDEITASALFIPYNGGINATADQAIEVLEYLAKTGNVIWEQIAGA